MWVQRSPVRGHLRCGHGQSPSTHLSHQRGSAWTGCDVPVLLAIVGLMSVPSPGEWFVTATIKWRRAGVRYSSLWANSCSHTVTAGRRLAQEALPRTETRHVWRPLPHRATRDSQAVAPLTSCSPLTLGGAGDDWICERSPGGKGHGRRRDHRDHFVAAEDHHWAALSPELT